MVKVRRGVGRGIRKVMIVMMMIVMI